MFFANPWGLLGLLAIPLILFIHLFQRKFPRLEIAGLHLWTSEEQVKTSGLRRDRLPISRSLILELLAAGLLTLLLAQPRFSNTASATHWVFVLDSSASMMAAPNSGTSFRDQAIEEMQTRVDESGRGTRVTIILTGPRPTMLAGPAVAWDRAETELEDWQPQKTEHQFQSAWDMASQLTEQSGKLVFVTDDLEDHAAIPLRMELVAVGESLPNLAFETARWSIDPVSLEADLYLRIRNHSQSPAQADIVGSVGEKEVFRKQATLVADASLPLSTPLPGGIKTLDLTIESPLDHLKTDSQLTLIEPGVRTVKYQIQLDPDHSASKSVRRFLTSAANVLEESEIEECDFVITDLAASAKSNQDEKTETQPDETPNEMRLNKSTWQLAIGPGKSAEGEVFSATTTSGPFLLDRRNPILEGLSLQGTVWAGIWGVEDPLIPMITADKTILLGERTDSRHRSFIMDIDFSTSNFPDSPNFPILLSNLIEGCRESKPGPNRWNYHLNEFISFDIDPDSFDSSRREPLKLLHDSKPRDLPRLSTIELPLLTRTGVYEIKDGERTLSRFAVNFFDASESDLTTLSNGNNPVTETAEASIQVAEMSPWIWMLTIGLALAFAIWNWAGLKSGSRNTRATLAEVPAQ